MPLLRERMAVYSAAELSAIFEQHALPFAPITRPEALLQDPHLLAVGMLQQVEHPTEGRVSEIGVPVSFSGTPTLPVQKPAPQLGQHSAQILREAGLSEAAIQALQRLGVTNR